MSQRSLGILVLLLPAIAGAQAGEKPPLASPMGVLPGDIDRKVNPCDDFYEYANGSWRRQNPIPDYMSRWSRRWKSGEDAKDQLRAILDEVSAKKDWKKGSPEQLIGDHYGACMNQQQRDQLGVKPLEPQRAAITAIKTPEDVGAAIRALHEIAVFVPFGVVASSDNHSPNDVIADVFAAGLGLPDRDYYLKKEPRFREARERYVAHIVKMFTLAGTPEAEASAAADAILRLETKLATASLDNVALRDPKATDHKTKFDALAKLTPHFDWAAYADAAKIPRIDLNVQQPKFLAAVDKELTATPIADWKRYLEWSLLSSAADSLSEALAVQNFEFYGKYLQGQKELRPPWKRCVESVDTHLGEALGQPYVKRHFPPEAKARMLEMVKNLRLAMKETIDGLAWMSPATKRRALEKLGTFNPKIGYPDEWKSYDTVVADRANLWATEASARKWNIADDRAQIGKPVDRGRFGMTPPTSNAYYNPLLNEIVFPAGILQPPGFNMQATDAVNYGAVGVVIGHEISHGFDDQGAQYAADGSLDNWWTPADLSKFKARGKCVVDQFEGYEIEPGIHHNGKLVLGESIGDLAGAKLAFRAYEISRRGKPPEPTIDGFTPEQQFFIAWGQWRGDAIRPETQRLMVQTDPHPTGKYRVNGPLSNLPQFREAFKCTDGAKMVRPAKKRCEVW
jgi:putative endopeptidase